MKLLKLLEGLYHELKTYNEHTRNTNAALPPAKQVETSKTGKEAKTNFQTIFGNLMYPGLNAISIHSYTATGRHRTQDVYASREQLKELEGCLRESLKNEVIGTFYIENGHLKNYEIVGMVKRWTRMQKGVVSSEKAEDTQDAGCGEGAREG